MLLDKSALVIFSGGMDSTVCLALAKKKYRNVNTISFSYGQKHFIKEITQAKMLCKHFNTTFNLFSLSILKELSDSFLVQNKNIIGEHFRKTELPSSWVPNRNALFIAAAHAFAQKICSTEVIIGVNFSDFNGFPDCRPKFLKILENALNLGSDLEIKIIAPLLNMNKSDIFQKAERLKILKLIIDKTHTCYNGISKMNSWGRGCGKCISCVEREKGWHQYMKEKVDE